MNTTRKDRQDRHFNSARINTAYQSRDMTVILATEAELDMVRSADMRATHFSSIAMWLIGLSFGVWVAAGFAPQDTTTPMELLMIYVIGPLILLLGVAFGCFSLQKYRAKNSLLRKIKTEAKQLQGENRSGDS